MLHPLGHTASNATFPSQSSHEPVTTQGAIGAGLLRLQPTGRDQVRAQAAALAAPLPQFSLLLSVSPRLLQSKP